MRADIETISRAAGLAPSADALSALHKYLDLLQRWNATYNLTAVRERDAMLTQHLADCLAIVNPLQRGWPAGAPPRVLDVGSGGGLPGVVLAALLPELQITCVDAVRKKTAFIAQVAATVPLSNLRAVHGRIEAIPPAQAGVIVSRAFASLADFTHLSRAHLAPGGVWLAMKGRVPDDEITALAPDVEVFHVEQLSVPGLDAQRCLIWMRPKTPPANTI